MRLFHMLSAALLLTLFAAGPSSGHNDRDVRDRDVRDRDVRDSDTRDSNARDDDRAARDGERREQDRLERELKDAADLAEQQAKDAADAVKDSSSDSDSSSGSGSSRSGSSGGGSSGGGSSGGGSSGSGSSGSGSSGSGSSGSGSSGSGSSGSGSSGSGSDDDDEDDSDDDDDSGSNDLVGSNNGRLDVETDTEGRERRKGELLVRGDGTLAESLRVAGFHRLSVRHLNNLDQSVIRVRVREGSNFDADLAFLRGFQGAADAEPNYVFRLSGGGETRHAIAVGGTPSASAPIADAGIRVGVIDTGADRTAPGLGELIGSSRAFGGRYTPRPHGTHVAQILVRQGVHVDVADVFQTDANGAPLATAESIARGIDWMAARGVPVINVSITGPRSALLSEVVAKAIARGSIIIAAAGNDGPAAPPVFPAAFPEVVGVTAVDAGGRVYRRANRGEHVDFAAFGVRVPVNASGGRIEYVSGTSYAAPLVAAAVARRYRTPRPGDTVTEVGALRGRALDMGDRGRDPVFGWGLVAPSR